MKSKLFKLAVAVFALLLSAGVLLAQKPEKAEAEEPPQEQPVRVMAADPGVVITMCLESGNIMVVGGDRREVRVNADDEEAVVTLRRTENPKATTPAIRLEVLVSDSPKEAPLRMGECRGTSDIELEVPRGATLYVKTREGDIEISDVAAATAETTSGNVSVRRVAKSVEAMSVSGDVSLEDSNGRIRLRSISGNVEATNAKIVEPNDTLYAKTMSGDVRLEQIAQQRVEAGTITGEVSLTGPLARGGSYDFKTTTGDITLNMPDNVSFQVTAIVSQGGEVITDFPLKYMGGINTPDILSSGKIVGAYGTGQGAATLNLSSFSGTLRLRKM
ncbi:MAG: DUF4097 family beta strand repeat protein [Pyrinomonadaceae bacterium]|nr:DUF4097 family beta strand repeat protein [Pyrinomonadaceae bacterium]